MRIVTFLFLLIVLNHATWASDPEKKVYPIVGNPAPNFCFELEKGKTQLLSEYNNKTVYLVFFATWCAPCRAELPHVQKEIWEKFGSNEQFKMLVIGREHTRKELEKFVEENRFTFPVVPDSGRKIFSQFAPQEIPRSYLINKNGKIVKISVGFDENDFDDMKKMIEAELTNTQK